MSTLSELLTVQEAAEKLDVSISAVKSFIDRGYLPAKRYGGSSKIHIDDLQEFATTFELTPDSE
ncbi:helix-turn-helix domain-containing protein [Paenibacillus aquistagni]|uniref:helix-turn-helix domain-containing protein n=1 Tax=Paenibacillus aquistagni TaxID=1852522 RepID=UPI000B500A54|nr:helix-turn-helix domain-containing protein [Paenibacillus aquistagni]